MTSPRSILLVESDEGCSRSLAVVLRRQGDRVHVARTRAQALQAARRRPYDLAVVDLFLRGGGAELARDLARRVPKLYLSFGARLEQHEILEAALGFPVCRKAALPGLLRSRASLAPARNGRPFRGEANMGGANPRHQGALPRKALPKG